MTFLDLSDAEGMFGLLVDCVADERAACRGDRARWGFLSELLTELRSLEGRFNDLPTAHVIERLRETRDSVGAEFARDPAMVHVRDCIEELERLEED